MCTLCKNGHTVLSTLGLLGKRISRYKEINYVCWDKTYSLNSTPCDSCQRLDETDYKSIVIHVIGFVVFDQILLLEKDVQYMFKHNNCLCRLGFIPALTELSLQTLRYCPLSQDKQKISYNHWSARYGLPPVSKYVF